MANLGENEKLVRIRATLHSLRSDIRNLKKETSGDLLAELNSADISLGLALEEVGKLWSQFT